MKTKVICEFIRRRVAYFDVVLIMICCVEVVQVCMYRSGVLNWQSMYIGPLSWLVLYPLRTIMYVFEEETTNIQRLFYAIDFVVQLITFILHILVFGTACLLL